MYLSAMGNSKNYETENLSLSLGTISFCDKFFFVRKIE